MTAMLDDPPVPPPPTINVVIFDGQEGPPEPDQCPACRYLKKGICACNYDWENSRWVDGSRDPTQVVEPRDLGRGTSLQRHPFFDLETARNNL